MPTADPMPDNIRRIAVLVSSVDSATARQLLLHLPTAIAKQVRHALQNLGPISAVERQRILTEFQSTAAKQIQVAAAPNTPAQAYNAHTVATPVHSQNNPYTAQNSQAASIVNDQYTHSPTHAPSLAEHSERGGSPLYSNSQIDASDNSQPSWKRMDIRALSHFLRAERATVVAVVINQLSPNTGVALLQQLPAATHREVLQAIANLQDIDEEAMQSIEEHLAERLKDYEQQVNGEAKGTRRVAALLAAAPPELQETWSRFVHIAIDPSNDSSAAVASSVSERGPAQQVPSQTHAPLQTTVQVETKQSSLVSVDTNHAEDLASAKATFDDEADVSPYIIPFPGPDELRPLSNTDRSLIQIEFEHILNLSPHELAQVLSAADSKTVLLALAGASPTFMRRFYGMLTRPDAKALASRLSKIGPLKLRDIDEAQRSVAELAANLTSPRSQRTGHSPSLRVAA